MFYDSVINFYAFFSAIISHKKISGASKLGNSKMNTFRAFLDISTKYMVSSILWKFLYKTFLFGSTPQARWFFSGMEGGLFFATMLIWFFDPGLPNAPKPVAPPWMFIMPPGAVVWESFIGKFWAFRVFGPILTACEYAPLPWDKSWYAVFVWITAVLPPGDTLCYFLVRFVVLAVPAPSLLLEASRGPGLMPADDIWALLCSCDTRPRSNLPFPWVKDILFWTWVPYLSSLYIAS